LLAIRWPARSGGCQGDDRVDAGRAECRTDGCGKSDYHKDDRRASEDGGVVRADAVEQVRHHSAPSTRPNTDPVEPMAMASVSVAAMVKRGLARRRRTAYPISVIVEPHFHRFG
jgi:hypothetical protein